jgi:hypothetical protein
LKAPDRRPVRIEAGKHQIVARSAAAAGDLYSQTSDDG